MATEFDYSSKTIPQRALFVAADEPLLIYPSVAAAQRHLEAIDVEDGVYPVAFGPNGEPFRITSDGRRVIIEATGEPNRPDELRPLLVRYLEAAGRTLGATATLDDLVAAAWAVESDFWQEHDPFAERFATRVPAYGGIAFLAGAALVLYLALR